MNEDLDPQDELTTEILLRDLRNIRESRCVSCQEAICGHEALMSLTMGFKNAPRCCRCLAEDLGHSREVLRDRLSSFIASRACYNEGWLWANQEEQVEPGMYPRCLWPDDLGRVQGNPQKAAPVDDEGMKSSAAGDGHDVLWDAGGMACGDLVFELRIRLQSMNSGQTMKILATDPGAEKDLPSWCRMTGNTLLAARHPAYFIRKK
jgi:TusA-related sulfurtransferase